MSILSAVRPSVHSALLRPSRPLRSAPATTIQLFAVVNLDMEMTPEIVAVTTDLGEADRMLEVAHKHYVKTMDAGLQLSICPLKLTLNFAPQDTIK
jgi:hypothetical protein